MKVWSATSPDGSRVALKFVDCQGKSGGLVGQEIRMMRRLHDLRHPNFIQLFSVCSSPPYIVITMERADGSLKELQTIYQQESGQNIPIDYLLGLEVGQEVKGDGCLFEQLRFGQAARSARGFLHWPSAGRAGPVIMESPP